jgi:hypothetical protein
MTSLSKFGMNYYAKNTHSLQFVKHCTWVTKGNLPSVFQSTLKLNLFPKQYVKSTYKVAYQLLHTFLSIKNYSTNTAWSMVLKSVWKPDGFTKYSKIIMLIIKQKKKTPWSESASKIYRPSDCRLSAKWCQLLRTVGGTWSAWRIPMAIFSFI